MSLKRIVLAAIIMLMIPVQLAWAMSTLIQNNTPWPQDSTPRPAVELKKEYDPDKDPFLPWYGWWGEKTANRGRITVTVGEDGWYGFEISWPRNKLQTDMWMLTAVPINKNTMQYKDCQHYLLTFNAANPNIIDREETIHLNGTGTISMNSANEMIWLDDQDHRAADCVFVKLNLADGGGL